MPDLKFSQLYCVDLVFLSFIKLLPIAKETRSPPANSHPITSIQSINSVHSSPTYDIPTTNPNVQTLTTWPLFRHSSPDYLISRSENDIMVAKKQINLLRGWPNPALLASSAIQTAAAKALSDPQVSTPGLLYGPDPGYQPLRESISRWLSDYYRNPSLGPAEASHNGTGGNGDEDDGDRICITGGASQNLACLLQVFTDPLYTRVWMVAPCYFLACRIFEDAGLRTRAVGEGAEGVDLEALEKGLEECEREANAEKKVGGLEFS